VLSDSLLPVFVGAPPSADSLHSSGRQHYFDGSEDRNGLLRTGTSAATSVKRRSKSNNSTKANPSSDKAPISLSSNSNEGPPASEKSAKPVSKGKRPAAGTNDSKSSKMLIKISSSSDDDSDKYVASNKSDTPQLELASSRITRAAKSQKSKPAGKEVIIKPSLKQSAADDTTMK
jgi:hypothetical protein